ncbi:RNA methyltransferase [uncultured Bartonella sp.]|uniref:TrmH family RNA methyltransferase n=1 Tax=uncultured Bartonella sp. TaxID=104108 RepID=UPI00262FFA31|nr:RNA methyltransferase [uncultured Bartonella sp.]
MTEKTPKDSHYARLRRQYRDMQGDKRAKPYRQKIDAAPIQSGKLRLYGLHTVEAALRNPKRNLLRLSVTKNALMRLDIAESDINCPVEIVTPKTLDSLVGSEAVHQGAVLETEPLKPRSLNELAETDLVIILDQVTDPHNVGAIMRSAVAFNAGALITTSRHSALETGVLAKSASGALELIDHICVRNLAESLDELHKAGFVSFGLDSEGPLPLEPTLQSNHIALVLGAEGKGLRQKTRETVSKLARLDMRGAIKSLNVSNAAAISLYAARNHLDKN